jgi:peptidyl-prolyl isomerase E (cyclophilin E)
MDLNEMGGKVLKVNLARPMKGQLQPGGNRAGKLKLFVTGKQSQVNMSSFLVWESEEWLQQYAKPLAQSGGVQGRAVRDDSSQDPQENADADGVMEE